MGSRKDSTRGNCTIRAKVVGREKICQGLSRLSNRKGIIRCVCCFSQFRVPGFAATAIACQSSHSNYCHCSAAAAAAAVVVVVVAVPFVFLLKYYV